MDKINGSTSAASSLQITENAPYLDQASKEILSNKEFLAMILKYTVKEYNDMEFKEIADCIEAESINRTTELSPSRTNNNRITGNSNEFFGLDEKMSRFDVVFKAVNPKLSNEETTYFLYIDIEPQNNYRPGYPIEKRGIYHVSRMISSQIPIATDSTNYGCLEKVYTIWICRNRIPKKMCNTMSVFEFTNTYNSKDITIKKEAYDLMNMVILRLGNPDDENNEDIFKILNALFYPRKQKSYEAIKEYVDFNDALAVEVKNMSGLGESVFLEGIEQGIEQGVTRGKIKENVETIRKKLAKGMFADTIADMLELEESYVRDILNLIAKHEDLTALEIANLYINQKY